MERAYLLSSVNFTFLLFEVYYNGYYDYYCCWDHSCCVWSLLSVLHYVTLILQNRKLRHSKHLSWDSVPGSVTPAFKCEAHPFFHGISVLSTWQKRGGWTGKLEPVHVHGFTSLDYKFISPETLHWSPISEVS